MRILIIKTTSLGDVVHNLPIVSDIKKQFSNALIDWVVDESFVDVLAMHGGINSIIPLATRRWRKALFSKQTWCEMFAFKRQLQSQTYDVVIDSQGLLKSGLITYLSNSPNKCGYDKTSARESIARFFYHRCYVVSWTLQAVVRNRLLAASSLGYAVDENTLYYGIHMPDATVADAVNMLPTRFIMALHGTSRDSKLWAEENWVALGQSIQPQGLVLVLPWGNHAEKLRAERIASQVEQAIVLPKLNLKSLSIIICKAQAIIGVDTGLAHLAVALNKPVIGIYTDTNPDHTGLYGSKLHRYANLGSEDIKTSPQDVLAQLKTFKIII